MQTRKIIYISPLEPVLSTGLQDECRNVLLKVYMAYRSYWQHLHIHLLHWGSHLISKANSQYMHLTVCGNESAGGNVSVPNRISAAESQCVIVWVANWREFLSHLERKMLSYFKPKSRQLLYAPIPTQLIEYWRKRKWI